MNRFLRQGPLRLSLLGVGLLWVALAWARSADQERGLLFEVRGAGDASPSFLLGTIHSEDPRVTRLPPAVQSAFDAASGFALEVVPDAPAIIQAMMTMTYTDGRVLREVLPEALYAEVADALAAQGMTEEAFKDFKPWAVMTQLCTPPAATGDFLDMQLYRAALAAGKRVQGLETMGEQLAIFDDLAEADQIALLAETVAARDALPVMFHELTHAYLERDLGLLQRLSDAYLQESEPRLAELFRETVVEARNHRMAERMRPLLDEGGWLIAVGALHLAGESGLVSLLRGAGYRLAVVY